MKFTFPAIQIHGTWLPPHTATLHPVAYSESFDLLVGVAASYWRMPALVVDRTPIQRGDRLDVEGYGLGVLGSKVFTYEKYDSTNGFLDVDGTIAPGYSGSPVLRAGTNRVVGIAVQQALAGKDMALACAFGLPQCKIVAPYRAAPIRRIGDLVNLSHWLGDTAQARP